VGSVVVVVVVVEETGLDRDFEPRFTSCNSCFIFKGLTVSPRPQI